MKTKSIHFPAVHTWAGSMSYKLEWNGLSMIYGGDTLPTSYMGIPTSQDEWAQEARRRSLPIAAAGGIDSPVEYKKEERS